MDFVRANPLTLSLSVSFRIKEEENKVFHQLTLTISEVRQQFLNVPIRCYASSPVEQKSGVVWLQEGATCYVVSNSNSPFLSKEAVQTLLA